MKSGPRLVRPWPGRPDRFRRHCTRIIVREFVNLYSVIQTLNFPLGISRQLKVFKAVSFVHNCFSEGCHFEELVTTVPIERERVGVQKSICYNNLYCFNVNDCLNAGHALCQQQVCKVIALPSLRMKVVGSFYSNYTR